MPTASLDRPDLYADSATPTPPVPRAEPQGGVMHVVGLTYRQLDYWTRKGYLRSEGNPTPGSGRPRTWPDTEVAIARAIVRLVGCGFTVQKAAELAREEATSERLTVNLCEGVSLRLHPDVWSPGTDHPAMLAEDVTTHRGEE